jgi:SAM-dependent methyltransferase
MDQTKLWNGVGGQAWVDAQAVLDRMFEPFEALLDPGQARRVLDVGCGTGATTLSIARHAEHCTGIDISAPMLALASARAEAEGLPATFIQADAQTHPFAPASFDLIVSRFGVMFFADPVAAFANLRRAGRELRVIAWREPAENPFMTTAERAAAPLLPDLPKRDPDGPGQFAFADPDRVRRILSESGWAGIDIAPVDVGCALPAAELVPYLTRFGPLGLVLADQDEVVRERIAETVRAAFEPYVDGGEVRYTAACWLISAAAPARR